MTKLGIVVEIEDHSMYAASGPAYTGSKLANESNWFATVAKFYINNPYVWFGTLNEPGTANNGADISAQQAASYAAIRGTGNNTIIMCAAGVGSGVPNTIGAGHGFNAGLYTNMRNIVWDFHFYSWLTKGSQDSNVVMNALVGSASAGTGVKAAQSITSADGVVPVILGEYGDSTDGTNVDANADLIINAAFTATNNGTVSGCVAWQWCPSGADVLVNNGKTRGLPMSSYTLTSFGRKVAAFIKG
jgi:hypothetical protein